MQGFQVTSLASPPPGGEMTKGAGLSDLSAFHPRPPLFLDTGFKAEVGTLEKCAVRHFGAA